MQAPSRKWAATQLVAAAAIATMWATTGAWDQEETLAAIGLVSQAGVGYFLPNDKGNPQSSTAGHSLVELVIAVLVILILVFLLLRLV